jgi:Phasin protein
MTASSQKSDSMPFFPQGAARTAAATALPKELLDTYEQANRAWLARVKSEVDLWTGLGKKLSATRSAPEAIQAYQDCVAQRMRMAAEDAQKMSEDCQRFTQKILRSLSSNGLAGESS